MMNRGKIYVALHLLLMLYSLSGVMSKLAASQPFLSSSFILYFAIMVAILGIYAIGWQQLIKRLPLTVAYANKAVTVAWGIIWGVLIFSERPSFIQLFGAALVLVGIAIYAKADSNEGTSDAG